MPSPKLKYEIVQYNRNNSDAGITHIEFHHKIVNIATDRCLTDFSKISNATPYTVYPEGNTINVRILAESTNNNFYWELKIWLVKSDGVTYWKNLTPVPIVNYIDPNGKADFNDDINW